MKLAYRILSFAFVTAALTAPLATKATAAQEVVVTTPRYYDRDHRDYHEWNDGEDRRYRVYLGERHRDYREFRLTTRRQQNDYWRWRHEHPEHD